MKRETENDARRPPSGGSFCMRVLKNKEPISPSVIVAARLDMANAEKPERI